MLSFSEFKALFSLLSFLLAFFVSYLLAPRLIKLANEKKFLDYPEGRKAHPHPMPYLGGAVIFISFWAVIFTGVLLAHLLEGKIYWFQVNLPILSDVEPWLPKIMGVFAGSLIVFVVGLIDDQTQLPPWPKLLGQCAAAFVLLNVGLRVNLVLEWGFIGYWATFFWIVLLMNAFNFIDSVDGHCLGIALISGFIFFAITLLLNQPAVGLLVIVFCGAMAGFMPYNFRPARMFLGDNGSLMIGYMLSVITLLCKYNSSPSSYVTPLIPILMFGVPIYDTLSVVSVRLFRRLPPWKGDRNHFAHRLIKVGMNPKTAVVFSYLTAVTMGLLGLLSTQVKTWLGQFLTLAVFVSIMMIVAFLEYYAMIRIRLIEKRTAEKEKKG